MSRTLITRLERESVLAYRELRLRAFVESSAAFSESFEDEKSLPLEYFASLMGTESEHFTLGAWEGEHLVAIGTLKRDKRSKARHKSFIHTMYVSPSYRGQGLGAALLKQLIAEARKMPGLAQIHLWVLNPETSMALKLYEQAGFIAQGTIVKEDLLIDGKYVDAAYMTLAL